MRRAIAFLLTLVLVLAMASTTAWAKPGKGKEMRDIKGNYAYGSILKLQEFGILAGYPDGTFRPNQPLKGPELELIIDRLLARQGITSSSNGDDKTGWKRFHSQVQVSRLDAAVALAKALGLPPVTDGSINPFRDSNLISDDDYKYLLALYQAGYIKGFPDGNFNPNSLLRRAEIAKIIDNVTGDSEDTIKPVWPTGSAVTASAIQSASIRLTWTEATDNDKVIGYKVLYDLANVTTDTALVKPVFYKNTVTIDNLLPETAYYFLVVARDASGNWSVTGPTITATTTSLADTIAPVWPSGAALIATPSATTNGSVALSWPDATDNVNVTSYLLYQGSNPDPIQTLSSDANSAVVNGLVDGSTYQFTIRARDGVGNLSPTLTEDYTE